MVSIYWNKAEPIRQNAQLTSSNQPTAVVGHVVQTYIPRLFVHALLEKARYNAGLNIGVIARPSNLIC